MHNIKEIRKDFTQFKNSVQKRNVDINFENLKKLDEINRELIQRKEAFEKEKKDISKSKDKSLFKNILRNIAHLEYQDKSEVACSAALKWMQTNKRKFDVIFLDPPFDQVNYESLLSAIRTQDLLAANGKIYLETDKRTEILLSKKQEVLKDKTIGDVRLMILQ